MSDKFKLSYHTIQISQHTLRETLFYILKMYLNSKCFNFKYQLHPR